MRAIFPKFFVAVLLATAPFLGLMTASQSASAVCWGCNHHQCVTTTGDGYESCIQENSFPWCGLGDVCLP